MVAERSRRKQQKQIFVSYSRSDRITIDQIVTMLRDKHYLLWMDVDERGIEPGEDWKRELVTQMSASEAVLACVSPDFLKSKYCQEEIAQAKDENKPIFPVIVRRLEPEQSLKTMGLDHLQYIDLTQGLDHGIARLRHVLPRPQFPLRQQIQRIGFALVALLLLSLFTLVVALSSGLGTSLFGSNATPSPTPIPSLRNYDLGIAVAYFEVPDDGTVEWDEADALAEQILTRLESELSGFTERTELTLGFLAPSSIGRVQGATPAEREANARDLARRHDADIVLYGLITRQSTGILDVQPEFYVVPETFADALEITGSYRLGKQIQVDGTLTAIRNVMSVNQPLSNRIAAAAEIFIGLTYYGLEQYELALQSFELAEQFPFWDETEGREVLYVLKGNTYVRMASVDGQNGDTIRSRTRLNTAIDEYTEATLIAPSYARPYTGLASAYYVLWNLSAQENEADPTLLTDAQSALESAENAPDISLDIGVNTREMFARLQIDYALWAYHQDTLTQSERDALHGEILSTAQGIIRRYDNGSNPSVQELASEAYIMLGLAAYGLGDCEEATQEYLQGIELAMSPRRKMFFYGYLGECYYELAEYDQAETAFIDALEQAREAGELSNPILGTYESRLDDIRSNS
jgi:tetratricopeptide (TPR) repeat protein